MNRFFSCLALVSIVVCGCGDGLDPAARSVRDRMLSQSAPSGERPIPEIRKGLKAEDAASEKRFVVRVRINAGEFPPFAEGIAAFMVTDATGHDGDEEHNPYECPFCKKDIKNVIARIEIRDESGKIVETDARNLFQLKEFDLLVVEGSGTIGEDDTLIIAASKIWIKR